MTTEYVWDGNDLVHERRVGAGADKAPIAPVVTWVFEPGTFKPVAKLEGKRRFGIVGDHMGSPTMLATEAGRIAWQAQLDVYGVPREDTAGIREEDKTENPWRYPGQYEDRETGLYYNRFRYYDPELGRYLSEDPVGLTRGLAQFGYVWDPLGWLDPFGLAGYWHDKGVWITRGGNPVFPSTFNARLPPSMRGADVSDYRQMKWATEQLDKAIKDERLNRNLFSPEQLAAIERGDPRIPGLTWHHHENGSMVQLERRSA